MSSREYYHIKEEFLSCNCDNEVLRIIYEPTIFDEDTPDEFEHMNPLEIAIFHKVSSNFQNKIRWIWRIIKTGNPWNDQIELDKEQVAQLITILQEYVEYKPKRG